MPITNPDPMTTTVDFIKSSLSEWVKTRRTGKISYEIDMSQGGIGEVQMHLHERKKLKEGGQ